MSRLNEYLETINKEKNESKLNAWENHKFSEYNKKMEHDESFSDEVNRIINNIEKDLIRYCEETIQKDKKENGVTKEGFENSDDVKNYAQEIILNVMKEMGYSKNDEIQDEVEKYFLETIITMIKNIFKIK